MASARWKDGSYGHDTAPSWILVDESDVMHAQAYYYTPANAQRFENLFGVEPYIAVSIIRDERIAESCSMTPDAFLAALAVASRSQLKTQLRHCSAGCGVLMRFGLTRSHDLRAFQPIITVDIL